MAIRINSVDVVFFTASRSERALVEPLLKCLQEDPKFFLIRVELPAGDFQGSYDIAEDMFEHQQPRMVFCNFDRIEMLGAAMACFEQNIPIIQLHAGDYSIEGSHDDAYRHMITLLSTIQFCNGIPSQRRTRHILRLVGKPRNRCYEIGAIQLDDVVLDHSRIPEGNNFDLVVYNPPTAKPTAIASEIKEIELLLDKPTLWIVPNEDAGRYKIMDYITRLQELGKIKILDTLPRNQYLALLEQAHRVIGNSSSFFLELPYFHNTPHIHIGYRNKGRGRETVFPRKGGSKRIVSVLKELIEHGKL